ncbi:MAG TPA: pyrroline-5-carboxylate reductase [bacterium]|nr:pyrroline-5-carboxylate reductase [bacterium]
MKKEFTVSFIGAGNMGEAMVRGLVASGVMPQRILAFDVDKARLDLIVSRFKVKRAKVALGTLSSDAVVVAVKPQVIDAVLANLASLGVKVPLVISIAAGVPVSRFTDALGRKARVVRVMPNTPALIGKGVSAFFAGPGCTARDLALARTILTSLGPAHEVKEEALLDAVTGLSGSGPAYVFVLIEALADAGVKMGLPRALALDLAARTVAGAAQMVIETGEHPASLKDKVASPGGTTIAGLSELERGGFRGAAIAAVEAATLRSREMGRAGKK